MEIGSTINDGYWHHVAISWYVGTNALRLNIDGFTEGVLDLKDKLLEELPKNGKIILGQTPQNDNNGDLNSNLTFTGRLTDFNMMDFAMNSDELRVLSLRCGSVHGNLISWKDARNRLGGKVDVFNFSSCKSTFIYFYISRQTNNGHHTMHCYRKPKCTFSTTSSCFFFE